MKKAPTMGTERGGQAKSCAVAVAFFPLLYSTKRLWKTESRISVYLRDRCCALQVLASTLGEKRSKQQPNPAPPAWFGEAQRDANKKRATVTRHLPAAEASEAAAANHLPTKKPPRASTQGVTLGDERQAKSQKDTGSSTSL